MQSGKYTYVYGSKAYNGRCHMDIIEKLYNVCSEHRAGDYSEISRQCKGAKYQKLKEKLDPELADELDELVDEILFSNLEELEENFRDGFCMGAELMLEIKQADIKKKIG